jgi:hypothetical protein
MANTTLSLTEENKNYLLAFLSDYAFQCSDTINDTAKVKLAQVINLLTDTIKD